MTHEYKGRKITIVQAGDSLSQIAYIGEEDDNQFWVPSHKIVHILSEDEKFQSRLRARLAVISTSPAAYYVAGWILSHSSKFNVSYPPGQKETALDSIMNYGVDVDDPNFTESSDKTAGWSCSVVTDKHGVAGRLIDECSVNATKYYYDTDKVSMQSRDFVLGFLGGLSFKFSNKPQNPIEIRKCVPTIFLPYFDAGVAGAPFVAPVVPTPAAVSAVV